MAQIKSIAATTEAILNESPFLVDNPTEMNSVPGATVYGVNLPGRNARGGDYQFWRGDGSTTAWTSTQIVNLANAHVDSGSLAAADQLRVVILVDGVPLHRVAAGASPGAGEFKTSGSGPITLTFGSTYTEANKIEMFLSDSDDVTTITLAANVPQEVAAPQVVYGSAAFQAIRLTR